MHTCLSATLLSDLPRALTGTLVDRALRSCQKILKGHPFSFLFLTHLLRGKKVTKYETGIEGTWETTDSPSCFIPVGWSAQVHTIHAPPPSEVRRVRGDGTSLWNLGQASLKTSNHLLLTGGPVMVASDITHGNSMVAWLHGPSSGCSQQLKPLLSNGVCLSHWLVILLLI